MPRDILKETLYELYPHLRGTDRMHDVLAAHYAQTSDEDDEEEECAREAWDRREEREIHDLAKSSGTTKEVIGACAVMRSWAGERVEEIARSLKVRQQEVIAYFLVFNALGVEGLKGSGQKDKSSQTKAIVSASGKRSPFPLTSVRLTILPFSTVETDGPRG